MVEAGNIKGFKGFYLTNALKRISGDKWRYYSILCLLITLIPALVHFLIQGVAITDILTSTEFNLREYLSDIVIFWFLFFFLIITRLGSDIALTTQSKFLEIAVGEEEKKEEQSECSKILSKNLKLAFNPLVHIFSSLIFIVLTHVLWGKFGWTIPLFIYALLMGTGTWLFVGISLAFYNCGTEIVGEHCELVPFHPDTMGGFRFFADAVTSFIALVTILWGLTVAAAVALGIKYLLPSILLSVGFTVGIGISYIIMIDALHNQFSEEKRSIYDRLIPKINATQIILFSEDEIGITETNKIISQLNEVSLPVLALKATLEEVRLMRDWPIDIPLLLKLFGGAFISLIVNLIIPRLPELIT